MSQFSMIIIVISPPPFGMYYFYNDHWYKLKLLFTKYICMHVLFSCQLTLIKFGICVFHIWKPRVNIYPNQTSVLEHRKFGTYEFFWIHVQYPQRYFLQFYPILSCVNLILSCVYAVLSCVYPILSFVNPIMFFRL